MDRLINIINYGEYDIDYEGNYELNLRVPGYNIVRMVDAVVYIGKNGGCNHTIKSACYSVYRKKS